MNTLNPTVTPKSPAVGNTANLAATVQQDGIVMDPVSITLVVTPPGGGSTTYNWPTGSNLLTRSQVGSFSQDVSVNADGTWLFVWTSVTPSVAVSSGFLAPPPNEHVTITVTDGTNPIVGVTVQAYLSPYTIVGGGLTNGSGQVVMSIPPGSYSVEMSKSKAVFANPYSMLVLDDSTPQTFSFVGTPLTISETGQGKKVRLYGLIMGSDGQAKDGVRVKVETVAYGQYKPFIAPVTGTDTSTDPADIMIAAEKVEKRTDSNGYWEADVLENALVRVEIPDNRFSVIFRVPNDQNNPTSPLLNIRDVRPDPGSGQGIGIDSDVGDRNQLKGPG